MNSTDTFPWGLKMDLEGFQPWKGLESRASVGVIHYTGLGTWRNILLYFVESDYMR